jgi:hypothetical protein
MEAAYSPEMLVATYKMIQCHDPDYNMNNNHNENLETHTSPTLKIVTAGVHGFRDNQFPYVAKKTHQLFLQYC